MVTQHISLEGRGCAEKKANNSAQCNDNYPATTMTHHSVQPLFCHTYLICAGYPSPRHTYRCTATRTLPKSLCNEDFLA